MSIITEALKKAGKERDKTITSKEYMNKILGPVRKETYKREEFKTDRPQFQSKAPLSKTENMESRNARYIRGKTLTISGVLLLLTIVSLAAINIFLVSSPGLKVATSGGFQDIPVEAEPYTNVEPEIALIESRAGLIDKMAKVFKSDSIQDEFLSNFELNGVVYDAKDSWAIINNNVVRIGDVLDGAKVISIAPRKVELLFKNERFDLAVKQ